MIIWIVYCGPTAHNAYFSSKKKAKRFIETEAMLECIAEDEFDLTSAKLDTGEWE